MKKLIVFLIMGFITVGFLAAQTVGSTLYVAVKTVELKSSTGFFASTKGTLNYGDRVTVLQVNGRFVEVRSANNTSLTGWTAYANLSTRQIVSGNTGSLSAKETALAGKGFNQEIENVYKTKGNLNYADVDRVEAVRVTQEGLRRFIEEGRLKMGNE